MTTRVRSSLWNEATQPVEIFPSEPEEAACQVPGVRMARSPTGASKRQDSQETTRMGMERSRGRIKGMWAGDYVRNSGHWSMDWRDFRWIDPSPRSRVVAELGCEGLPAGRDAAESGGGRI